MATFDYKSISGEFKITNLDSLNLSPQKAGLLFMDDLVTTYFKNIN